MSATLDSYHLQSGSGTAPEQFATAIEAIAADYERRAHGSTSEPPIRGLEIVRRERIGAATLAPQYGGFGLSTPQFFELLVALAEADPDLAHILRIHFSTVEDVSRADRVIDTEVWRSRIAAGEIIGGVSSELGTRPVGISDIDTRLVRDGDRLVLRGRKFYSTGAQFADYLRITALDENDAPVAAYVSATEPGVVHLDDWDGIGQRHTGSGTTVLNDVVVAPIDIVHVGARSGVDRPSGAFVQFYLHAIAAGILRSAASDAAQVVRERARTYTYATDPTPAHDPEVLEVVGEVDAVAFLVHAAVRSAAAVVGHATDAARLGGIDPAAEHAAALAAAKVKVAVEGQALNAASRIFDVGGASTIRTTRQLDRHWRNLRTLFSHNPTIYKARVLGDVAVNGAQLPESGLF